MKKIVFIFLVLFPASALANANAESTCIAASEKIASIIEDWYRLVQDVGAGAKNASVIAMHSDYKNGEFLKKYKYHCIENWKVYEDTYICFSGIRSELGAAMCLHPDTNKNGWSYW